MKNKILKFSSAAVAALMITIAISANAADYHSSPVSKGIGTASGLKSNGIVECSEDDEESSTTSIITSEDLYYLADCIDEVKAKSGINKDMEDALNAEIAERIAGDKKLDEGLKDCFTSVSSGKQKLVEALLTKSLGEIDLPATSTFEEIRDGILRLKTSYSINDLDADIEYIYHTHINSDGVADETITEDSTSDKSGGCFTTPRYKIHHCNDDCYDTVTKNIYHTHSKEAGCYKHTGTCVVTGEDSKQAGSLYSCSKCGTTTYRLIYKAVYTHKSCGLGTQTYTVTKCGTCADIISGAFPSDLRSHNYTYSDNVLSCQTSTTTPISTYSSKEKVCGQEDGEPSEKEGIECYTLGCKMDKDNIIGARIIFKK